MIPRNGKSGHPQALQWKTSPATLPVAGPCPAFFEAKASILEKNYHTLNSHSAKIKSANKKIVFFLIR